MKKTKLFVMSTLLCLIFSIAKSQTYASWGKAVNQTNHMYDTISFAGDSLRFVFPNANGTAFGSAKLIVYYEGNFGDGSDFLDVLDETLSYFYTTNSSSFGYDCSPEDSSIINLNPNNLNTWVSNNTIVFTLIPNTGTVVCGVSRVRVRLVYNYCLSGLPVQYATPSISNSLVCSIGGQQTLTGTPTGGSFSGPGVSGAIFNPVNLSNGAHILYYTATDSQSCTTTGSLSVFVKPEPKVNNGLDTLFACFGSTINLTVSNGSLFTWFSNSSLSNSITTNSTLTTPSLTQTTNYWVASTEQNNFLAISTFTDSGFGIVDHDWITGDDRGGIAVTPSYVYLNGDVSAVRYDLNLTTGVSVPKRDGIFSDLHTGKLWTLWNVINGTGPQGTYINSFNLNALRGLDSNLNYTNEYIYLSQSIDMGNYFSQSGIFAGMGTLGLFSGNTEHWYVIDMDNGVVSDLGHSPGGGGQFTGSENWADWGVIEKSCSGVYSAIYNSPLSPTAIKRRTLPNGPITNLSTFPLGLSDMASLTYSPWNSRWYWHYEGSSGTFGGTSETLGFANANATYSLCPGGTNLGCAAKVTVRVPEKVNFVLPEPIVCLDNGPITLSAGTPTGGVYSGIGVGTNSNGTVFLPVLSGTGTYSVIYSYSDTPSGCEDFATQIVTVNLCTGLENDKEQNKINIYPNPSNGSFNLLMGSDVETLTIEVFNTQGQQIFKTQDKNTISGTVKKINLFNQAEGIYIAKISDGSNLYIYRLIVSK